MDDDTLKPSEKLSAKNIVSKLVPKFDVDSNLKPSQFIQKFWEEYNVKFSEYRNNKNINGKVFEELVSITLVRKNILPFYIQAKVAFIPNANYDLIVYTKEIGPIALSLKTSLRERWKQADLEAIALKNIHRKSLSYLVTLDAKAAEVRSKNTEGSLAINGFIVADQPEYDELLIKIKGFSVSTAPSVQVVNSHTVISSEKDLF